MQFGQVLARVCSWGDAEITLDRQWACHTSEADRTRREALPELQNQRHCNDKSLEEWIVFSDQRCGRWHVVRLRCSQKKGQQSFRRDRES